MPVEACRKDKKPGFRWGKSGTCYTYTPNNTRERANARLKAELQGRAIHAQQARRA